MWLHLLALLSIFTAHFAQCQAATLVFIFWIRFLLLFALGLHLHLPIYIYFPTWAAFGDPLYGNSIPAFPPFIYADSFEHYRHVHFLWKKGIAAAFTTIS